MLNVKHFHLKPRPSCTIMGGARRQRKGCLIIMTLGLRTSCNTKWVVSSSHVEGKNLSKGKSKLIFDQTEYEALLSFVYYVRAVSSFSHCFK